MIDASRVIADAEGRAVVLERRIAHAEKLILLADALEPNPGEAAVALVSAAIMALAKVTPTRKHAADQLREYAANLEAGEYDKK